MSEKVELPEDDSSILDPDGFLVAWSGEFDCGAEECCKGEQYPECQGGREVSSEAS